GQAEAPVRSNRPARTAATPAGKPQRVGGRGRMPTKPSRSRLGAMKRNEAKGVAMFSTRKLFEYGGGAASIVLVAFGIAAIVLGVNGRSTVHSNLALEQIVGTPDMTPSAIKAEAKRARLPASIKLPTVAV